MEKLGLINMQINKLRVNQQKKVRGYNGSDFPLYIKHFDLILLFLPGFLLFFVFNYLPMYGITIAFKDFRMLDGIMASPWVGLAHFIKLFSGSDFWKVVGNTLNISILKIIFGFPAPLILALMLNEVKNDKYKKLIQTVTYLPHFFSWVVLGGIIISMFSMNGPINLIMNLFGFSKMNFFANGSLFVTMLVVTSIWQGVGWGSIVYLAALSGIDDSLYEAARIDGASRFKQIIYISLPCLLPTIVTIFILNLGHILNGGFDQIFNLYNPMVYDVADVIDTYVLRHLQAMDYSFSTAAGLFKSVVGLVMIVSSNYLIKKLSGGEQGII